MLSVALTYWVVEAKQNWIWALGLLLVLGAHELGHFFAALKLGIPVRLPIFIPGMGAFVLLKEPFKDARKEAWVGIGGPLAGVATTVGVHVAGCHYEIAELVALAHWSYGVHLFNLIPAGMLDGGHIAALVGPWLWFWGAIGLGTTFFLIPDLGWDSKLVFLLLMIPAVFRAGAVLLQWFGLKKKPAPPAHPKSRIVIVLLLALILATCIVGLRF